MKKPSATEVSKMTKLELSRLLLSINPELYFQTSPRLATTKNFRVIVTRELEKKNSFKS